MITVVRSQSCRSAVSPSRRAFRHGGHGTVEGICGQRGECAIPGPCWLTVSPSRRVWLHPSHQAGNPKARAT
ncbi:hypothetical protein DCW30_12000 [Streptomyces alfalfae]|uniref:Uncharacterized protein n=1 Tax=Streptomyces alfalfae TaxID=1642299 RepID=A0ABM6GV62_9ACTN|nr:hypothetical protein A7J05_18860 [Streptomyces alfalfae]AYA17920.1 hypothetical protein D3X13_18260 [Streptomyces fradiae]RXX45131.1 hypothetical protein DCW30_12000 [Streptomyces alfalfae]RZM85150.1 hypothetical protein D4104_31670 [Streptomyces alfalfae]